MANELEDCLAVLGLGPGATPEHIKEAYRDLTKVWHPDRFDGNPRLQKKADEQLKVINGAYQCLRSNSTTGRHRSTQDTAGRVAGTTPASAKAAPQPTATVRMKNRLVRMSLPYADVHVNGRPAALVDLSLTGARLLLDFMPPREGPVTIRVQVQRQTLELPARVVRVQAAEPNGNPDSTAAHWTVGVTFVGLSPQTRQAIPRFYNLLVEVGSKLSRLHLR